jgi:competence protein ComEC
MRKRVFICKISATLAGLILALCSGNNTDGTCREFSFSVLDIGEGLSQIGICGSDAAIWDMGDTFSCAGWQSEYSLLGSPHITAIIISHCHRDHYGGLRGLSDTIDFSGLIYVSPYEDTTLIRNTATGLRQRIFFCTIAQGDTLPLLADTHIECLWPPYGIGMDTMPDSLKNRYSLCFRISHGGNSILVTSDIDTFSERNMSSYYGFSMSSDIIVVPHHGSAGSVDEIFYGYVNPSTAVISCGTDNEYGFPSQKVINLLYQIKVTGYVTADNGTVTATSNGYYWNFR